MLDEEMDHIIREAADNHHPAYNDKAWEKMEMKLDKHLPQKTDRRRLIFFLLFFVLLGAGILFTVNKMMGDNDTVADRNNVHGKEVTSTADNSEGKDLNSASDAENDKKDVNVVVSPQNGGIQNSEMAAVSTGGNTDKAADIAIMSQQQGKKSNTPDYLNTPRLYSRSNKGITSVQITNPDASSDLEPGSVLKQKRKPITGNTGAKQKIDITNALAEEDISINGSSSVIVTTEKVEPAEAGKAAKENELVSKEAVKTVKKEKEPAKKTEDKSTATADKKKSKNKFGSNFGLTVSIGPDVSFVKLKNTGRTTLTYGAGLSYDFAKRFTARAGFYVSKKIYKATPDQYNPPGGNYPNLTGVDANCKVYEIPVSVAYNFGARKNHSWFGGAGLSSFIMKKEDYTYNYKTPAGQTYTYYREINNENKHYFAVLTLSAGYKYQLSKKVSVQAEPYAKIPLGGVGQGKIKLNSAGALFTVTVKPFKNKK